MSCLQPVGFRGRTQYLVLVSLKPAFVAQAGLEVKSSCLSFLGAEVTGGYHQACHIVFLGV